MKKPNVKALVKQVRARRRPRLPRNPAGSTGGFVLKRKVPDCWLSNTAAAGVAQVSGGPATSFLVIGTPVAHPVFTGIYNVPFSMIFSLDQLAQYTDITAICDKFKITNVAVKVMYNATAVAGTAATAAYPSFMPIIKYITDSDDGVPQSALDLNAKMGLKTKTLANGKMVKLRCSPRVAAPIYQSAVATAYEVPNKATYINSTYPTVPHYGIKGYFENFSLQATANATSCATFEVEMTIKLKDLQ